MEGYQIPQGGPMVLGAEPGVAAGAWTDIVSIVAPAEAAPGEQVIVDVSVKNIGSYDFYLAVTAVYDSTSFPFQFDYLLVSPGQTVVFRGWFTMPSKNVRVTAWSWYWDGSKWVDDDSEYKDIAVVKAAEFRAFGIREYDRV